MTLDPYQLRKDFPVLARSYLDRPIIYLDNACMTLKPRCVVEAMERYYNEHPSCHGRSAHLFSRETTACFAMARAAVQRFIGAARPEEIIFTKNATEAINLVAHGLSYRAGDAVLCFEASHNSDLLPWLRLKRTRGVHVDVIPSFSDTSIDMDALRTALRRGRVRLVSVPHVSNLSGITLPVKEISALAHEVEALVLIDGTQAASLREVDVLALGADFYAFSAHKMLGPTGVGCLYGRYELLEELEPLLVGGEAVTDVTTEGYELAQLPARLEAGLQNYGGADGLRAAIEYLEKLSATDISEHLKALNRRVTESLTGVSRVHVIGPEDANLRRAIFNFIIDGVDAYDIAKILDASENIMLRAGRHCAHSWFHRHGLPPSVRASFYIYNTIEEADLLAAKIRDIATYF